MLQGKSDGTLVDIAFIFKEAGTFIHYQATLYLVDALDSAVVITCRRFQVCLLLRYLPQEIVAAIFEVEQSLTLSDVQRLVTKILCRRNILLAGGNASLEECCSR